MKPLLAVTGPTASGKTAYALQLAREHNGELVNCDARQVYRGMDIVTGKDIPVDKDGKAYRFRCMESHGSYRTGYYQAEHARMRGKAKDCAIWLYDIVDPATTYSSHEFVRDAEYAIADIWKRGKTPVVVGGSYFYLAHLLYGLPESGTGPDIILRKSLENTTATELLAMLRDMSPDTADALNESDRANPRRLIRRIEILKYRGSLPERTARYQYRNIAGEQTDVSVYGMPFASRDTVRKTITARVDARLRAGAIEETRRLIKRGVGESAPGFNTIGYVQILQFLRGTVSAEEMRAAWITAEVRYTKRQMTFMRKDPNILWLTDGK